MNGFKKVTAVSIFLIITSLVFINILPAKSRNLTVGEKAPDFTLSDTKGNVISLSDYKGKNVVLIDFFTTWCPSCVRYMSVVEKFYKRHKKKGLVVLSIDIEEPVDKVTKVVEKYKISYTMLLDKNGATARDYNVRGVPYVMVIDKKGNIRWIGRLFTKEMKKLVSQLLAE
ncbi:MAG: TlpA family protein disulfide reductase [Candidatus Omnitrophica bacterium]|nr:TlpA family protein disulfide reductase [Candidatus Omnitrophota bacterium]